ncbi:MAG: hypothetical protein NTW21_38490 [Verrucomicrobia bacterium]|nr:hypothetical protein [Verrucomicrobiota bacterium]
MNRIPTMLLLLVVVAPLSYGKGLQGNNWHLSYRPIKDGKLDWYQEDRSFDAWYALAPQSLDAVLEDVKMVLKPTPVAWGEPATGLQAGLTLKSTSREPKASAVLAFHLRNAGDRPVKILKLAAQARFFGEYLPLEIRSSGTILKYQGPLLEPPLPPDESEYITLNPGDADSTEVTFVPEHWKLVVPFETQAVFVFNQTLGEEKTVGPYDHDKRQWKTVGGLWTGEARSQAVTVKMGAAEQGAAQPAADSAAMVAEALERIHKRVAALEGQHPALKGIADAKPQFGGDPASTRREAAWSFANNATEWGKAETPSAVDPSQPFCRIILHMWIPSGPSAQPVADARIYQVGGVAWDGFLKVWSSDAKLVEAVKAIVAEELDRFTKPPPPAAPPAKSTLQLRIDPAKQAVFGLALADVRKELAEHDLAVAGDRDGSLCPPHNSSRPWKQET